MGDNGGRVLFFFFYSRAAVSVVFRPCCPVQVLSFDLCLHHVFLSEQIKMMMMMMMMMMITANAIYYVCYRPKIDNPIGV